MKHRWRTLYACLLSMSCKPHKSPALAALLLCAAAHSTHAALLAYEPFTNAPGTAILGSDGGSNFSGAWQTNASGGIATHTATGLTYTDASSNLLTTLGGAGFFQGLTTANNNMQPIRTFNFGRGTNGTDGVTTWISFLIARQGPVNGSATNSYLRGANLPHDLGAAQKLAIGNSSGAATNTVGLIPAGAGGNLKSSAVLYGGRTNFVVVRIDHVFGANDNAWLFVNPNLAAEPATSSADTNSLGAFDFSVDRLRIFAGGQSSASQPYAEIIVDEYRIGETYADIAPHGIVIPPAPTGPIIITNTALVGSGILLAGIGGNSNGLYSVLASTNILSHSTNWPAIATNSFDGNGNFNCTNPLVPGLVQNYFRLLVADTTPPPPVAPSITTQPTNFTVLAGQPAAFAASATGTTPLNFNWLFNDAPLGGATSSNLSIAIAQLANAGGYSLRVANVAGAVTSSIATLTVFAPPVITAQPLSQTILISNAATFNVTTTGTAPLRYQWFFNTNTALPNATNSSHNIATVLSNNAGTYSVILTNNYGAATSLLATLTVAAPFTGVVFYVATNGNDSSNGSFAAPFKTIGKGHTAVGNGGVVYLRGGTYAFTSGLGLSKTSNPTHTIRLWAYPGEVPIVNASGASSGTDAFSISGHWYHLRGITITLAGHNGIKISGNSNIIENCVTHDNGNTGLHLTGGTASTTFPSGNLILNCDSYRNYDPPIGGNADGFSAKWDIGPGNIFDGCRAWENSDDGWDLWMGNSPVLITNSWAFRHGIDYWFSGSFNGNGNGFKLGGNYIGAPHVTARCIAFGNAANGYDQNNNTLGQVVDQNTGWNNSARNFNLNHGTNTTPHIVRNNLSFDATSSDSFRAGTVLTSNSWQVVTSPAVSAADVQSVDESVAILPRNADGSLPVWPFLRPVLGGRLVDKGANLGQPFNGTAPDLGAYETP